ncbi:MAG: hypothetical protein P8Y45_22380 [Exilibacterium sp.]
MPIDIVEITVEEMEGLIARVASALDDGLSLEPADIRLVLLVLRQFAFQQERLNDNEALRQRFLKLMGLVSSSEKQNNLFNKEADEKDGDHFNNPPLWYVVKTCWISGPSPNTQLGPERRVGKGATMPKL